MKQFTVSAILIWVLCWCMACNGDDAEFDEVCSLNCATIIGKVTTGDGTEPLEGLNTFVQYEITSSGYQSTAVKKARSFSDTKGNYEIAFDLKELEENDIGYYRLTFHPDNEIYLSSASHGPKEFHDLESNEQRTYDFFIPRKTFIEITPELKIDFGTEDYLRIKVESPYGNIATGKTSSDQIWHLEAGFEPAQLEIAADVEVKIIKTIRKDGEFFVTERFVNVGKDEVLKVVEVVE